MGKDQRQGEAECRLQASMVVDPSVPRFIALAMSPHGELTLACRTVMHPATQGWTGDGGGQRLCLTRLGREASVAGRVGLIR